jgi:hypothetical protein
MPGGQPLLGFASFAAVKFAGYTGAAWALNRSFQTKDTNVWKVGGARTALGLAVGATYGGLFFLLGSHVGSPVEYFAGLVPIRLAEWSLIIWYFYQRGKPSRTVSIGNSVVVGTLWSFALDAIGIFSALVVPGGAWIC